MNDIDPARQYKLYIFDFDYTLFDTSRGQIECMKTAFAAGGMPSVSEDEIRKGMGIPLKEFFGQYSSDPKTIETMEQAFLGRPAEMMVELTKPLPGTISVINALQGRGSKLAICTGNFRDRVEGILRRYSIEDKFDMLVCSEEIRKQKPDPEGLLKCMSHFDDIGKNQIAYVGDHCYDILAAQRCGVDSIAVTTGITPRSELLTYRPTLLINNLIELIR